ncbi:MAG TPA: hypothetical protein DCG30_01370 [Ruminococcus sp.]|nr:hypothetical protein [Ruminococcus sp.]
MKLNIKIRLIFLLIVLILCRYYVSESNYKSDSNYESGSEYELTSERHDSILSIASYTKSQYDKGTLKLGYVIANGNLDNYEKNKEIAEIFANHDYFYKAVMNDENTVIIQQVVFFHSVTGYIATKNETLNTTEEKHRTVMYVPSALGYDNNLVIIDGYIGQFDKWHLYSYRSGM